MTIEIAEDWFNNNISGQQGFTLDDENEVYRKTILEADLSFAFSADTDGEFSKEKNLTANIILIDLDFQILSLVTRCQLHPPDLPSMTLLQSGKFKTIKTDNLEKPPSSLSAYNIEFPCRFCLNQTFLVLPKTPLSFNAAIPDRSMLMIK